MTGESVGQEGVAEDEAIAGVDGDRQPFGVEFGPAVLQGCGEASDEYL
jgi:hypothetical protein